MRVIYEKVPVSKEIKVKEHSDIAYSSFLEKRRVRNEDKDINECFGPNYMWKKILAPMESL